METVEITSAEHAANIVEGRGKTEYQGMTKVISVRIPLLRAAQVQALAYKSGITRNGMISEILKVGLDEINRQLSEETILELSAIASELVADEVAASQEQK